MLGKLRDWGCPAYKPESSPIQKKFCFTWRFWSFFIKITFLPSLFTSLFKVLKPIPLSLSQIPEFSPLHFLPQIGNVLPSLFIKAWSLSMPYFLHNSLGTNYIVLCWTNSINICGIACLLPKNNKGYRVHACVCTYTQSTNSIQNEGKLIIGWG